MYQVVPLFKMTKLKAEITNIDAMINFTFSYKYKQYKSSLILRGNNKYLRVLINVHNSLQFLANILVVRPLLRNFTYMYGN